jgi:hypothetical protein
MTDSERDLLMPFLRDLVQSRNIPGDEAADTLIRSALGRQPNASYLLVQRALTLEAELASARRRIDELEGRPPAAVVAQAPVDFLNPVIAGWGEGVERKSTVTTSKKLYDFFKEIETKRANDLESLALIFIAKHSVKIWLVIFALIAIVVAVQEKIV